MDCLLGVLFPPALLCSIAGVGCNGRGLLLFSFPGPGSWNEIVPVSLAPCGSRSHEKYTLRPFSLEFDVKPVECFHPSDWCNHRTSLRKPRRRSIRDRRVNAGSSDYVILALSPHRPTSCSRSFSRRDIVVVVLAVRPLRSPAAVPAAAAGLGCLLRYRV